MQPSVDCVSSEHNRVFVLLIDNNDIDDEYVDVDVRCY